ncbi:hypothetical protein [Piscinibacter terrae]|nr:hypothetical protein [Albitalea terrae]
MSWHDCHVHGFRVFEAEHGSGELQLDLDYILEWKEHQEKFSFLLVPVRLQFHEVFALRVALDWATPTAGMGPFSISGIEKRAEPRTEYTATVWRLPLNWPEGLLEFEASGFTQIAWGREVHSSRQFLAAEERVAA